jgi:Rps23 Pro-64 3,4-dihydroxylase Tpa1-like proline 4-hydroxylase
LKQNEINAELERRKYLNAQKQKVVEYKQELAEKNNQIQEFLKKELEKKRKVEEKYQKHMQEVKDKLIDYHNQKELLKKISGQKIQELQQETLNFKPIRVKRVD